MGADQTERAIVESRGGRELRPVKVGVQLGRRHLLHAAIVQRSRNGGPPLLRVLACELHRERRAVIVDEPQPRDPEPSALEALQQGAEMSEHRRNRQEADAAMQLLQRAVCPVVVVARYLQLPRMDHDDGANAKVLQSQVRHLHALEETPVRLRVVHRYFEVALRLHEGCEDVLSDHVGLPVEPLHREAICGGIRRHGPKP
mmetsp:Transcript_123417/g.356788  ORF Transcript_123417/g.356788 Transcript_123417/m.356788 type:complete len:201 (+) Transcript_123417:573-1175(+)